MFPSSSILIAIFIGGSAATVAFQQAYRSAVKLGCIQRNCNGKLMAKGPDDGQPIYEKEERCTKPDSGDVSSYIPCTTYQGSSCAAAMKLCVAGYIDLSKSTTTAATTISVATTAAGGSSAAPGTGATAGGVGRSIIVPSPFLHPDTSGRVQTFLSKQKMSVEDAHVSTATNSHSVYTSYCVFFL
ncbi:hypothetical protein RB195_014700 [Necator americanus]|uniref:Uncharacterized protein n=1 Tax=Necator americanus TaxID=51031 RepID=A0ABR1E1H2_NECAM